MSESKSPDFDSIKQINPYGEEYWSARALIRVIEARERSKNTFGGGGVPMAEARRWMTVVGRQELQPR